MTEFIVVYEEEFEPRRGVQLIEAKTPEEARAELEASVPPGMGLSIRVLNVITAVPEVSAAVAEAPTTDTPTAPTE